MSETHFKMPDRVVLFKVEAARPNIRPTEWVPVSGWMAIRKDAVEHASRCSRSAYDENKYIRTRIIEQVFESKNLGVSR